MTPIADDTIGTELAGVLGLLGVIVGSIPVEADARRWVSSPIGDMAGVG